MTDTTPAPRPGVGGFTDGDLRRAAALLAHTAVLDAPGARLILDDAEQCGDGPTLTLAALFLVLDAAGLRTPEGAAAFRELARHYAEAEAEEENGQGDG
jgi:hypothetical protein